MGFTVELGAGCMRGFCDYDSNTEIFTLFLIPTSHGVSAAQALYSADNFGSEHNVPKRSFLEAMYCSMKHKEKRKGVLE